ncbi:hypothetical protein J2S49_001720 [Arcanobacterium wilhelmae]|uniref:Uncharacterized protein n=1 Tax=Arcanobacterium wilhelmae TaxID=1803177 RepID=A0ABT9ND43_9ACTO|nr:hypothetical protein [Arcanobacterium wilhelmae]MDP9801644.1 hypothetical protein [Arcanobacterium wilhelmae]WFN90965.1 hypothetical protein P8A24_03695 [Arcanobacterium wilhelmae]
MTLELTASARALESFEIDPEFLVRDHVCSAYFGLEIGALGAAGDVDPAYRHELGPLQVNWQRLASAVRAAQMGGMDFVSIDSRFLLKADVDPREGLLDGARAAARIAPHSIGGVLVEVPGVPKLMSQAIDIMEKQDEGWAGLIFHLNDSSDFLGLSKVAAKAQEAGVKLLVIIGEAELVPQRAHIIAPYADAIELRCPDPILARKARFALREAGEKLGKEIHVYAQVGVVISASESAARDRAELVGSIHVGHLFGGRMRVLGTVYDVADAVEALIGMGAADGVWFMPCSLPADQSSVIKGVVPLIRARTREWRAANALA